MIFQTPNMGAQEEEVLRTVDEIRRGLNHTLQSSKRWTGFLRRNMLARAIQGSNSIEGYNVTFEDAVAVVEGEEVDAAQETVAAVSGYRTALTYALQLSDDQHFTFNEELIRSLHFMMLSYAMNKNPGRWRPGLIFVRRQPSGEIVYEGPDSQIVPNLMHEFVSEVCTQGSTVHVIVRAAMVHLNLVMIHPFSDGNGRMGRALQTLVLARDGILSPPFSSIEEYLGSRGNTEAYYQVLADVGKGKWNPDHDARPWIRFCLMAHLQQATTVARRARETARLWNELEAQIAKHKLADRVIYALYDAAIGFKVRSARYRSMAEVSAQVATIDLKSLIATGLLLPRGEKKGRVYVASPVLGAIREKTREQRIPLEEALKNQLTLPLL